MWTWSRPKAALVVMAMAGGLAVQAAAAQDVHRHGGAPAPAADPAIAAYLAAAARMHADMTIELTGDPDVDFARGMIPHHQGAIDMARVLLDYGQDPELRALAAGIIAAQEQEIVLLQSWLQRRGKAG